ncbi:MAG: flagellinolysin [Lachnospiraceae bacterium]|nr:flagellinolysin [Lachnospiraceae bacterium]
MVVRHNLTAMNANRQLGITTNVRAKSSEKLSSGYKINRAADDAAGLTISEKMRRQIRGLTRASENALDGISFVQTADGALNEVHEMLQRGNELAVKAANGTLSASDRESINDEIIKLKEEINSIGQKVTFNEIRIFPEDGSSAVELSAAQHELAAKIANEYIPTAVSQIVNKLSGSLGGKLAELAANSTVEDAYGMKLDISNIDGPSKTLAYMQSFFHVGNPGYDEFDAGTLLMKIDSADLESVNRSAAQQQELESTIAHELMHGVMDILLPEGMSTNNDPADDSRGNLPKWFKEGTAQLIGGGFTTGWNNSIADIVKSSSEDADKLDAVRSYLKNGTFHVDGSRQLTPQEGMTVEDRPYGHGYLACAYLCQLASGQTGVSQGSLIDGANKIFNALMANEQNYKNGSANIKSFEGVINSVIQGSGKQLNDVISEVNIGEVDAAGFVLKLANACNPGSGELFGAGSLIASSLSSSSVLEATVSSRQPMYVTNMGATTTVESVDTAIYLQVGADAGGENRIRLKRFALNASALGIEMTNTRTEQDSTEAITHFGGALANVSAMRSYYGAMQNRLEHTIRNLDNVVENTTAAESRIRDTDMAEEMVRYSKNNILAQAGQSMLAQANQTTQGVLALLQ